jgi:hypothetical protein
MPVLSDPRLLIGLVLIIALVIGVNFVLINLLRGKRPDERESSVWGRALGGARRAQRQQTADYDKLHQMVTSLQPKAEEDKPHE